MMIKVAFATVAAAALCAPAMAPAATTSAPAVSNVAFSVPMKNNCKSLLLNLCGNTVQIPVQACNNNIASNNAIAIFGKASSKGGKNNGKCSQSTKSSKKNH